jgi:DNA modification methylase
MTQHQSKNLQIGYVAVSLLKPDPKNPRKHSAKQITQIAASIEKFGFNAPLLVNAESQVIAGHGRLQAAKKCGLAEVPVIHLDHLSPAQARAYMIADNKLTENAQWDEALLVEAFQDLSIAELDFSLDITGFEMNQIDLMIDGPAKENEEEPLSEPPCDPVSQLGDLWLLGSHRLYCGDSLQQKSFELLMQNKKARQVFTDPPYNVPINGHVSGLGKIKHREFAMAAGEMSPEEFTVFLQQMFKNIAVYSVDGAIFHICMDWRHVSEIMNAGTESGAELKNICVWCKDNAGMGTFYRSQHEFVFVFKHGTVAHTNNFGLGQNGRYRTNVWRYPGAASFARQTEEGDMLAMHPTVKPTAMVADAILDCSKRGEIVLDPFLGSGTTLIAAEKTGRICHGIELDPTYVDMTIQRWEKLTGKQAMHAGTGQTFSAEAVKKEGAHG